MTAEEVLRAGVELLGAEPEKEFKRLARVWHPDLCKDPRAREVTEHLLKLRARVGGKQEVFTVSLPEFEVSIDSVIKMPEPGKEYDELRRKLAKPERLLAREGASFVRPPDSLPLVEVLRRRGPLPAHHVAWMASRLYELTWEADKAGWMVGGLYLESLLVLVQPHGLIPLDMRFMVPRGTRMCKAPAVLLPLVPEDKNACAEFDLACVNKIALRLLGDPTGTGNALLLKAKSNPELLPQQFLDWFRKRPQGPAAAYYRAYRARLNEIFGPPKYHVLQT